LSHIPAARRLVDSFRREHPKIPLDLEVGWSRALLARLASGELDASFTLGAEHGPDFEELVLEKIFLELDMAAVDPLAERLLTPEALAGRKILVFARAPNPGLFDLLYSQIRTAGAILIEDWAIWSRAEARLGDAEGLLVATNTTATGVRRALPGRIRRTVEGVAPVPFKFVRRREASRAPAELIWALARGSPASTAARAVP
jgi:DNA-binding transcriptional LysR family regulator